jgi:hypothetical protein
MKTLYIIVQGEIPKDRTIRFILNPGHAYQKKVQFYYPSLS